MTREELYQALNFIGDNWTGDDAHACHEAIERIATLEARAENMRLAAIQAAAQIRLSSDNIGKCHVSSESRAEEAVILWGIANTLSTAAKENA